jgi:hypothetical protein
MTTPRLYLAILFLWLVVIPLAHMAHWFATLGDGCRAMAVGVRAWAARWVNP